MDGENDNDKERANQEDDENKEEKGQVASDNIEEQNNSNSAEDVFKSKYPNQMITIPKQKQSLKNRISKEVLDSEK